MEEALKLRRKLFFLLKLSLIDDKIPRSFSDFERFLGFEKPQIDFREVMKFLVEKEIFKLHHNELHVMFFTIDFTKLRNYIDELDSTKLFYDYFLEYHNITW